MSELEQARSLAGWFAASTEAGSHWAFLIDGGAVYFARGPLLPGAPFTPMVRLIQGIYHLEPRQARRIVRRRIYASYEATAQCWGMLKVAARRMSAPFEPGAAPAELQHHLINAGEVAAALPFPEWPAVDASKAWSRPGLPASDTDFLRLARELSKLVPRQGPLYACDRPVAALLVSSESKILAWSLNTNAVNRTRHAERNLLESWYSAGHTAIPEGSTLYVSLKPCRMCAGALWEHATASPGALRVVYAEHDPGPAARETVLDARSPDRRRELSRGSATPLELQLETHHPIE